MTESFNYCSVQLYT